MTSFSSTQTRIVNALADVIEFGRAIAGGIKKGFIQPDSPAFRASIEQNRLLNERLRAIDPTLDAQFYPYGAANDEIAYRNEQRRLLIAERQRRRLSDAGLTPAHFTGVHA